MFNLAVMANLGSSEPISLRIDTAVLVTAFDSYPSQNTDSSQSVWVRLSDKTQIRVHSNGLVEHVVGSRDVTVLSAPGDVPVWAPEVL
jgi:hypothetical protein